MILLSPLYLFILTILYVPYTIYGVVQQSGISDQTSEVPIDISTCSIISIPPTYTSQYSCSKQNFIITTNATVIPPLLIQWYYRSTVVSTNGTGCTTIQIECSSLCGSSSVFRNFNDANYYLPSCGCTTTNTDNSYSQNISIRILTPFNNNSGIALSYPLDCGSNPLGSSKIIYSISDPLPLTDTTPPTTKPNNDNDRNVYGAPLEVVIIVGILSVLVVCGVLRGIIRYQNSEEENENKKVEPLPDIVVTDDHVDEVLGAPPPSYHTLPKQTIIMNKDEESKYDNIQRNASGIGMIIETANVIQRIPGSMQERSSSVSSFSSVPSTSSSHHSNDNHQSKKRSPLSSTHTPPLSSSSASSFHRPNSSNRHAISDIRQQPQTSIMNSYISRKSNHRITIRHPGIPDRTTMDNYSNPSSSVTSSLSSSPESDKILE